MEEEFSSEEIIINDNLSPVDWSNMDIHDRISKNLSGIFIDTGVYNYYYFILFTKVIFIILFLF